MKKDGTYLVEKEVNLVSLTRLQFDLTMANTIDQYINLMDKIESMLSEISGVSKQREGSISSNELVGNVERSVVQSAHITEP